MIIHTSEHRSGILVVHKDILTAKSGWFKAALSEAWGRNAQSVNDNPASPKVYVMDLQFDRVMHMALPVIRVSSPTLHSTNRY